jgi:hypothetical protein
LVFYFSHGDRVAENAIVTELIEFDSTDSEKVTVQKGEWFVGQDVGEVDVFVKTLPEERTNITVSDSNKKLYQLFEKIFIFIFESFPMF